MPNGNSKVTVTDLNDFVIHSFLASPTACCRSLSGPSGPEVSWSVPESREVLHGVGADGVGVKFPIFAVNCCCLPLSFRRSREKRRKRGKMRRKRGKMRREKGENHSDPIYTNPMKNLPRECPRKRLRRGVSGAHWAPGSGVSKKCPESSPRSVKKVSRTFSGHSRHGDTPSDPPPPLSESLGDTSGETLVAVRGWLALMNKG